jgi:restriction endonuclease S subunit
MKVELPRYPAYQPTESEWLGEMPMSWDVVQLSRLNTKLTNGFVGPTRDILRETGVRYLQSLHIKDGNIVFDVPYFVSEQWSAAHKKSILQTGDVLIVQTGDIGQVAAVTAEFAGCNCHALIIVSSKPKMIDGFFLSAVLRSHYGFHSLKSVQTGALHPHLNCTNIRDIYLPVPPLEEQQDILAFLGRETAKIDRLREVRRKQIERLREQRITVINHAVTKGLDYRVTMRPSGVEWLGEIPSTWRIWPVKRLATYRNGFAFKPEHWTDHGDPIIRIQNLTSENFIENRFDGKLPDHFRIENGDFIISWSATLRFFVWNGGDAWLNQHLFKVTVHKEPCDRDYYPWLAGWFLNEMAHRAHGSTMVHLTKDAFGSFKVPVPPKEDQASISQYLTAETRKIDTVISKYQRELDLLAEYRNSLISHAEWSC